MSWAGTRFQSCPATLCPSTQRRLCRSGLEVYEVRYTIGGHNMLPTPWSSTLLTQIRERWNGPGDLADRTRVLAPEDGRQLHDLTGGSHWRTHGLKEERRWWIQRRKEKAHYDQLTSIAVSTLGGIVWVRKSPAMATYSPAHIVVLVFSRLLYFKTQ